MIKLELKFIMFESLAYYMRKVDEFIHHLNLIIRLHICTNMYEDLFPLQIKSTQILL